MRGRLSGAECFLSRRSASCCYLERRGALGRRGVLLAVLAYFPDVFAHFPDVFAHFPDIMNRFNGAKVSGRYVVEESSASYAQWLSSREGDGRSGVTVNREGFGPG